MLVDNGLFYHGIRMFDGDDNLIIDEIWTQESSKDNWSKPQVIPKDQRIIGFQGKLFGTVSGLTFLLGKKGEAGIVGELWFPEMNSYPNFE